MGVPDAAISTRKTELVAIDFQRQARYNKQILYEQKKYKNRQQPSQTSRSFHVLLENDPHKAREVRGKKIP